MRFVKVMKDVQKKFILQITQIQMKKLVNPTTYFFEQAEQVTTGLPAEIEQFVKKLINKDQCQLCRLPYDITIRIPRILIHCGHTFCTPCLQRFFMKNRVRCPMCLKLVKQLDSLQRLPINHTIFAHLIQKEKVKNPSCRIDAAKFLYTQFERVQKQAHRQQNPQKYDDESGLPFCVFHNDRVEHFYCESHKTFGCRVCIEIGHSKADCQVVDLYTVDNPAKYQNILENRIDQPYDANHYSSYLNNQNKGFGYGNILDPALIDDDEQSDQAHKSV